MFEAFFKLSYWENWSNFQSSCKSDVSGLIRVLFKMSRHRACESFCAGLYDSAHACAIGEELQDLVRQVLDTRTGSEWFSHENCPWRLGLHLDERFVYVWFSCLSHFFTILYSFVTTHDPTKEISAVLCCRGLSKNLLFWFRHIYIYLYIYIFIRCSSKEV